VAEQAFATPAKGVIMRWRPITNAANVRVEWFPAILAV
jgi:hypothetical protein